MAFASGEVIKECIVSAVAILTKVYRKIADSDHKRRKNVPLSNHSVARLVNNIAAQKK
jgi:hypothetical protein